jgi:fatty-acyl-CoA synthase
MSTTTHGANWVEHVARHAMVRPDDIALCFEEHRLTWRRLHERVGRLAAAFSGRGVAAGDRVAILMTNRLEVIETTLATNMLGAIAVPLNFRLAAGEVRFILGDCDPALIVTDSGLAPLLAEADPHHGVTPLVVSVEGAAQGGAEDYETVLADTAGIVPPVDIQERDIALVMYTSGTTGRPKGAMLTHLNLLMSAISMIRTHRLVHDDDVYMFNVPLFHIGGIGMLPAPLMNGTRSVVMPTGTFDAARTLETMDAERVTTTFLVPAQWQALCAHPDAARLSSSLRAASWGGAPATTTLLEQMQSTFPHAEIVAVFGQTETSPPVASMGGVDAMRKVGSVGRPVPLIATRIVDQATNDVVAGEVGEIVYQGPPVMAGYWNDDERTREAFAGGWFHSGDLVREDEDGYLYVVDRLKDMIISGGENVYCAEVENAVASHPGVAEVAVVGGKDERWGETPVAIIVPADPAAPPALENLVDWTRGSLASYKKPTRLVLVDELPRNPSGKVLKHVLRDEHGAPGA